MREIVSIVGVLMVSLVVVAAGVFGANDRTILVPSPEAATENFARLIAARRFDLAMNHLASRTARAETPHTLSARFQPLFETTGKINRISAEDQWMQQAQASARATIEGDAGTAAFDVLLIRENGLWRVGAVSDLVR